MLEIRKADIRDGDGIWEIIREVIKTGDTYVFAPDSSKEKMLALWFGTGNHTFVAADDGQIVGTFVIKDNKPDLGSHIANASYMTSPKAFGRGIGTAMGLYSIDEAIRLGYLAMQFNIVVKSNGAAVRLWQRLGFDIIGEIPEAFAHAQNGLTNAYIMYRKL
jgi:ribosomal protein S18 acetylase RimI-like enzyme